MKIVCASSMPYAEEAFATLGDVTILEGRKIRRQDLLDAEILAIRSTTPVSRDLIDETSIRFVGTATIGTDHMDTEYLEQSGITWCDAPGSNADSVADYVTSALLSMSERSNSQLAGTTLGVIGVGQVGSRVVMRARALGMDVVASDPSVERCLAAEEIEGLPVQGVEPVEWLPVSQLAARADYVTLHVPLEEHGPDATRGMAGANFFDTMKPGAVFLNTCRGDVMDTGDLKRALAADRLGGAVIDTWQDEPSIDRELLNQVGIGTPHIAGYSWEGRVNGTRMVYEAACRFLDVRATWVQPRDQVAGNRIEAGSDSSREDALRAIVRAVYDVRTDDASLRSGPGDDTETWPKRFDRLRQEYPGRREFSSAAVNTPSDPQLHEALENLGFRVS